jgi:hypothetical protein
MTIMDIIIKILLFFGVFYGAIVISAFVGKKIREQAEEKEDGEKRNKEEK